MENLEQIQYDMKKYENLYNFDHYICNLKYSNIEENEKINIAKNINNNLSSMDYLEKINIYKKFANEIHITNELLKFELENLIPEKINDFSKYINEVKKLLVRYTKKAGGYFFEDNEWDLHDMKSRKYKLFEHEIIFDNSIHPVHETDIETFKFVKNLINLFNKYSNNFGAAFRYIKDTQNNLTWIIIKLTNKLKKPKKPKKIDNKDV